MVDSKLDQIIESLEELVKWRRVLSLDHARSGLESVLNSDKKKAIYELSDGQRSAEEICNAVGAGSAAIVRGYWSEWEAIGIVEQVGPEGKRVFSLADLGVKVP